MQPVIGFKEDTISELVHRLMPLIADEFLFFTKTRNAHWNVEGPDFHSMYVFFEKQFNELDEPLDPVAERMTIYRLSPSGVVRAD